MSIVSLNEYMNFVHMVEDADNAPPFKEEDIAAAEYFSVEFEDEQQAYCLKLHDADGNEISRAYWEDSDFMQIYMEEYYDVEITDEDLDDEGTMVPVE